MELAYKPDLDRARQYWRAFWTGEIIDRPCVCMRIQRPNSGPLNWPRGLNGFSNWDETLSRYDECASRVLYLAEAVPFFQPNFGPDQFAAWVGADLRHSSFQEETSWSVPVIRDWDADARDIGRPHGVWWEKALEFYRRAGSVAQGKFAVGVPDTHSNMDALSALRGPQDLCMDLLDAPEQIDKAMATVRRAFAPTLRAIAEAAGMSASGYIGWLPFYSEEPYAVLQCDFACMVSPEHFRRWILPALEEESSLLSHTVYHYDGPEALVHLKDVLSIPNIRVIQWTPGAGNPPLIEWMDLFVEIQKAGKGLLLGASPDQVKVYHRTLRPEGVLYDVGGIKSAEEAEDLLAWLKANT